MGMTIPSTPPRAQETQDCYLRLSDMVAGRHKSLLPPDVLGEGWFYFLPLPRIPTLGVGGQSQNTCLQFNLLSSPSTSRVLPLTPNEFYVLSALQYTLSSSPAGPTASAQASKGMTASLWVPKESLFSSRPMLPGAHLTVDLENAHLIFTTQ